jgi:hypothetical protein
MGEYFYEYKKFGDEEYKLRKETTSYAVVDQIVHKLKKDGYYIRVLQSNKNKFIYGIYSRKK